MVTPYRQLAGIADSSGRSFLRAGRAPAPSASISSLFEPFEVTLVWPRRCIKQLPQHSWRKHERSETPRDFHRRAYAGCRSQWRSEEHTSELQSRLHLVCRLLLEKKKQRTASSTSERAATTRVMRHSPSPLRPGTLTPARHSSQRPCRRAARLQLQTTRDRHKIEH